MATPNDWRIDDIERLARAAAPAHEVTSLRSDVGSLEHSLRETRSEIDGLRTELSGLRETLTTVLELVNRMDAESSLDMNSGSRS